MRPSEGRAGQRCYLSIRGEINRCCEALFLFEEGADANLAVSWKVFSELRDEERTPVDVENAAGQMHQLFFITAPLEAVAVAKPVSWGSDFEPLYDAQLDPPSLRAVMARLDEDGPEAVESEPEPPAPPRGGPSLCALVRQPPGKCHVFRLRGPR